MLQGRFGMGAGAASAVIATLALSLTTACGGSAPEPKDESSEAANGGQAEKPKAAPTPTPETGTDEAKPTESSDTKPADASGADPTFPEGASVDQATAAVPKGGARSNLDAERLAEPLQAESVYEPCKVGTQHFKVRVAVWAGQAVGVDVTTPNKKLAECIDKQIRALKWPDKLRSLNTVEFSF